MRWLSQQFKILKPQNLGCPFQWYFVQLYIPILSHVTLATNFDSVQVRSSFGIMWNWLSALCLQLSLISLMRSNVFYLRIPKKLFDHCLLQLLKNDGSLSLSSVDCSSSTIFSPLRSTTSMPCPSTNLLPCQFSFETTVGLAEITQNTIHV